MSAVQDEDVLEAPAASLDDLAADAAAPSLLAVRSQTYLYLVWSRFRREVRRGRRSNRGETLRSSPS